MRRPLALVALVLVTAALLVAGCTETGSSTPISSSRVRPEATATTSSPPDAGSSATPEQLVAHVERAFEYAHAQGKDAAIREFNDRNGSFVRDSISMYAFDSRGRRSRSPTSLG